MKVKEKLKNKLVERRNLLQFQFVSTPQKCHVVAQLVQEVAHVVVVAVVVVDTVIDLIVMKIQDVNSIISLYSSFDQPNSFLAKSPSQQQANYYQQTGEYHNDEPQSRPYRGGSGNA